MYGKVYLLGLALFSLAACTSAEQKPESKWDVKVSQERDQKVWVVKPDGSKQCAKGGGLTVAKASEELRAKGVIVHQGRNGTDGRMRIQKCGADTGRTVELEISKIDVGIANQLGFVTKNN